MNSTVNFNDIIKCIIYLKTFMGEFIRIYGPNIYRTASFLVPTFVILNKENIKRRFALYKSEKNTNLTIDSLPMSLKISSHRRLWTEREKEDFQVKKTYFSDELGYDLRSDSITLRDGYSRRELFEALLQKKIRVKTDSYVACGFERVKLKDDMEEEYDLGRGLHHIYLSYFGDKYIGKSTPDAVYPSLSHLVKSLELLIGSRTMEEAFLTNDLKVIVEHLRVGYSDEKIIYLLRKMDTLDYLLKRGAQLEAHKQYREIVFIIAELLYRKMRKSINGLGQPGEIIYDTETYREALDLLLGTNDTFIVGTKLSSMERAKIEEKGFQMINGDFTLEEIEILGRMKRIDLV